MADVLRIEGLGKSYGSKLALRDVSLAVADNEYVSLLGPSGSGKTVLLRLIAGFELPDRGRILFDGKDIATVPAHKRGIGFVFQNFALFPHLSVYDNIGFGLVNRESDPVIDPLALRSRLNAMVELVGLSGLEDRGVHQISGGQRQRVALARTLVSQPRIVLLDEPLGALDANLRTRMRGELRRIRSQLGVTFLHVTGSESEALAMGDRIVVLNEGLIGQVDTPDIVYNSPLSPNVVHSLNCYNLFAGNIQSGSFLAGAHSFPLTSKLHSNPSPAYAIRQDLISVRPSNASLASGEAGLTATYLASEYTGAAFMYFFRAEDGHIVEVENHLSHRAAQNLDVNATYQLVWKADDAIVYG